MLGKELVVFRRAKNVRSHVSTTRVRVGCLIQDQHYDCERTGR